MIIEVLVALSASFQFIPISWYTNIINILILPVQGATLESLTYKDMTRAERVKLDY